jgi:hypothetical protein
MALTVEDGSVVAGADSYVSLTYASTYFVNRLQLSDGVATDVWDAVDDDIKEASLRYATQYVDKRFDWNGSMADADDQELSWPRYNAYDEWRGITIDGDVVPTRIKDAVCELAMVHAGEVLNEVLSRGGDVRRVQVGPISEEYFESASAEREYPFVDALLKGLHGGVTGGGGLCYSMVRG